MGAPMLQTDGGDRRRRSFEPLRARHAAVHQPVGHVLQHRPGREQVKLLEDESEGRRTDTGELVVGHPLDVHVPSTRTLPSVGRSRVPATASSVDLPEPEGPVTATNSPAATESVTSRRAKTGGVAACCLVTCAQLEHRHWATSTRVPGSETAPDDLHHAAGEHADPHPDQAMA